MFQEIRYALRVFRRTPGFTAVVVLTLALGIGVNTAIFSLIDALMLRTLPVRHATELLWLTQRGPGPQDYREIFSHAAVRALAERQDVFAGVAGFSAIDFDVTDAGLVTRVPGAIVTGGFYETLGVDPAAGRLITRDDDRAGAPLVAVMSDAFWARKFSRGLDALGRTIEVHGVPITLVGVTPAGFDGATVSRAADLTVAVVALPQLRPGLASMLEPGNAPPCCRILVRPQPGLSPDAAARLNAQRQTMDEPVVVLEPGSTGVTALRDLYRRPLYALMAVVALVLLVACANVASLLLARASTRQREMAVRVAIGAGRSQIVRQLLIESTMLSMAGAALGVAFAWTTSRVLVDLIAHGAGAIVFDLSPNGRVIGFASAMALATGLLFGLAPVRYVRTDTFAALRQDSRTTSRRSRLLPALVAVQIALSLVLVAAAGLFARTWTNLRGIDPGFSTDGTLVIPLERLTSQTPQAILAAVQRVPGVTMASLSTQTPLDGTYWTEAIVPASQASEAGNTRVIGADARFFETMRMARVAGRGFTDADSTGAAAVAMVNERYAARFFEGQNPIGRRLAGTLLGKAINLEVIGVVRNTNEAGLRYEAPSIVYVPLGLIEGQRALSLSARVAGPGGRAARDIRAALQPMLPTAFIEVRELSAQVSRTLARERLMASLAGAFGALALVLASIGLYGLLAYHVAQRTREIGIRMALGSPESRVVLLIVRTAGLLVLGGLALGLPAAWAASRGIASMLFGLGPLDPVAIGGAIALLVASALVAAFVPARRAARVDPLVVLKQD